MNRSTMSSSPPPGPPLLASATITRHETAEPRPEAGGGEAGEGERPGADLQRHDGDGDAEQQRDEHAEDEGDAEGDEQLRQRAGVEQRVGAVDPLGAEQHAEHGGAERGRAASSR